MNRKIRIMVIDDEPIVGKRIKRLLEKEGYEVAAFTEGETALIELSRGHFDIVVTDLKMEGIDGLNILKIVKGKYHDTRVIIITGVGQWLTATEAFDKGAFDFIIKPFKIDELKNAIQRAEKEIKVSGEPEQN
jgi:DNA-binding NtrC family response regulator